MLSKKTKVSVKNKENKTACFIEIEELLNSPELISDLPCLGIEEQEVGLRARRLESGKEAPGQKAGVVAVYPGCRDMAVFKWELAAGFLPTGTVRLRRGIWRSTLRMHSLELLGSFISQHPCSSWGCQQAPETLALFPSARPGQEPSGI